MLEGKKTYITAVAAILGAISAYLSGEAELADSLQIGVTALLALFLRSGVEKNKD